MKSPWVRHFILDGENNIVPVTDVVQWSSWMARNGSRRVVAQTDVGHHWVSTVFVGTAGVLPSKTAMRVFETMIFAGGQGFGQIASATWDEAVAVHWATVLAFLPPGLIQVWDVEVLDG